MMKSESFRESETSSSSNSTEQNKRITRHASMITTAPTIHQPNSIFESIRFMRSFLFSTQGLLCFILLLVEFSGLICSAAIPKLVNNEIHLLPEFSAIRDAYLFFTIFGLLFTIFILIFYSFNFKTVKPFNRIPLVLIIITIDIIWLIAFFILAILCAAKEESLKDPAFIYGQYINTGAYGAASFFGFVASLVYGVDAGFLILKAMRGSLVM